MDAAPPSILPRGELWIGGDWVGRSTGGTATHVDPASGQPVADFLLAGADDVDAAVRAAKQAYSGWRDTPASARRDLLLAIAARMRAEGHSLAAIGAVDAGTPVMLGAMLSSTVPADWFTYYAGWADKLEGAVPTSGDPSTLIYTRRVPFGVVALVTAFNAPMAFIGMKVAAALAAGNTVVLKPSELAPWVTLRFAELCREVGLPDGVLNVVPGGREAGEALVRHPGVDRISFTGGGHTARAIMRAAAENLTPVTFELGGKSAAILFEDAPMPATIQHVVGGSVGLLAGQACIAGTRILIQRTIYEATLEQLRGALSALPIGHPAKPDTLIGPMINRHHCDRIMGVIDAARHDGARLVCGGGRVGGDLAEGYYIEPTLFADTDPDSSIAQNEIFGPVIAATPFDTEEEAVAIANNSRYGLAGYVFTSTLGRAHRVAHRIEAGLVTINTPYTVAPNIPFGGFKESGFGREGGHEGVLEMSHGQSVLVGLD